MRIALFDFCDTIVNFQTADRFVYYVIENTNNFQVRKRGKLLNKNYLVQFFQKLDRSTKGEYSLHKRFVLWQLRGLSKDELKNWANQYYKNIIVPNIYIDILKFIKEYQRKGYMIYLVSGGYDIYLKYFVTEYGLDGCFCTKLKFRNGIFTGLMDGNDCMGVRKVKALNRFFDKNLEDSVAYSDSRSDLPLLLWADKGIVVSKNNYRKWVAGHGLKEFILSGKTIGSVL